MKRRVTHLVVHCTDSLWGNAATVRRWHLEKGWKDIGYHFVILNGRMTKYLSVWEYNGEVEVGRRLDDDNLLADNEVGAHALGYNAHSIGVVLVGVREFTNSQFDSLAEVCRTMSVRFGFPLTNCIGHYEVPSGKAQGKTCPNFDMTWFRKKYLEVG